MSHARRIVVALVALIATGTMTACGSSVSDAGPAGRPTTTTAPTPSPSASTPAPGVGTGSGGRSADQVQPQPPSGSCHYAWMAGDPLPDRRCTPGATDPRVTQADIATTICHPGWAAGVRPPERVTAIEKQGSAAAYGYTGTFATAEYDHLIPLELGGSPNDPANLWVEPNDRSGATSTYNAKDRLEGALHHQVCAGRVPLAVAQDDIAADWVTAASHYDG